VGLFGRRRAAALDPLPAPPFAPDPAAPPLPSVPTSDDDPERALHAAGVELPAGARPLQAATDLTVWRVPVEGDDAALDLWASVRAVREQTGWWPVLVDDRMWDATAESFGEQPQPVVPIDAGAWLQTRADELLAEVMRGEPAPWAPEEGLDVHDLLAAADLRVTAMLLVPSLAGWEVPGGLGWSGAVNHDIGGDVHTAMLRRWGARWGIELVAMGLDTLALAVARPPATPRDALEAAVEMTLYCPDLVFQGTTTVDALVPHTASSAWLLWWD
jgi:hypothetical protein